MSSLCQQSNSFALRKVLFDWLETVVVTFHLTHLWLCWERLYHIYSLCLLKEYVTREEIEVLTQHVHGLTLRLTYLFHLVVRRTHKVLSHEFAAKFNNRFPSGSLSLIPIKYELMHTSAHAHIDTHARYVFPSTRYQSYLATNVFTCLSTDVLLYHSYKA